MQEGWPNKAQPNPLEAVVPNVCGSTRARARPISQRMTGAGIDMDP